MARPKKKTVDYFPHIIKDGKTITILENRFGNDGYAFWFKLLEILGSTKGHSYRYENTTNKEFLAAKTNMSTKKVEKILDLLADLDAIDKELWKNNIIWSDNFIENIEDVYKKRSNGIPEKPVIESKNQEDKGFSQRKPNNKEVSDNENTQTKLKKTKLNKSKVNNTSSSKSSSSKSKPKIEEEENNFLEDKSKIPKKFNETFGSMITTYQMQMLNSYKEDGLPEKVIIKALEQAALNNANSLSYVKKILDDWLEKNIDTVEKVKQAINEHKSNSSTDEEQREKLHDIRELEKEGWNN